MIALFATLFQGVYGNVDVVKGVVVGLPAVAGVIAGTALQQRVPERMISVLFAILLVAVAVHLLVG